MSGISGPLRVCHIITADVWAGAEVQLATLSSYLGRQPDITVTAVLLNEGRLARELRTLGVEVAVIDERQHSALGILRLLVRFLRAHPARIVHTHKYKDTILGGLAAKLTGTPHVIRTMHGLHEPVAGWNRVKAWGYEALDKAALWCFADRILAVSTQLADALTASGYPASSITSIHNGVDLGHVRATRNPEDVRRELGIDAHALVIGTAGRLSPVKAHDTLLRAARLIVRERSDARFLVVGDGPLRDDLLRMADRLGIARACCFPGPRADVHNTIAAMDIFVLPSLHEGIPMALLEAMALQRPVVATAVGGVPEIVTNRSNGLLVERGDEQALASACLEVACNTALARRIAEKARQTVAEQFSHEANGAAVLETYRAVSGTRGVVTGARPGTLKLCRELMRGFAVHAWRSARHAVQAAIERRRMMRIRRKPRALIAALGSARRILFVCQGNIIRSPFAASLIARYVAGRVSIGSAGLAAIPGRPPHPTALQLATALRVDLSGHAASPLDAAAVAASDAIFVMDLPQLVLMRTRFPEARAKTFLLTCLASDIPLEVRDPYAGDEPEFQACFDHIARAVPPLVSALSSTPIRP